MTIDSLSGLSSISLNNISAVYNREQQAVPQVPPPEKDEKVGVFGDVLAKVQETGEEAAAGDSTVSTMTLTQVMPNGSLLVQKVDGDQLVSEELLNGVGIQEQFYLQGMPGQVFRAYMAGMGIATAPVGAIYNAFI